MGEKLIKSYEISVWDDKLTPVPDTEPTAALIKPMFHPSFYFFTGLSIYKIISYFTTSIL